MSAISELMRESPGYKKVVLAAAVTAGVGACVYLGYRCAKGDKIPASRPPKPEEKKKPHTTAEKKQQEHVLSKSEAPKSEPLKFAPPPSQPEEFRPTGTAQRSDELSTSGTFEKISLTSAEPESFEHLTISQVNPLESSAARETKEEKQEEGFTSSTMSFLQSETDDDGSISILTQSSDVLESLSFSHEDPSVSFISSTLEEPEVRHTSSVLQHQSAAVGEAEVSSSEDDAAMFAAAVVSGVNIKDENDIVVVEQSSEESGSEKFEEENVVRSGIAAVDTEYDASRVSPVFGQQTYQRVHTESDELEGFDPAKSHPASFGFKFGDDV